MTDKTDNRLDREAGEPVAWMTSSDWRSEPLATADKSVASAWRADNRQVTPLYASQPKALTDDLLVQLFYAAQGGITQFRIKARALLEAK
jgi:hypothetical protein